MRARVETDAGRRRKARIPVTIITKLEYIAFAVAIAYVAYLIATMGIFKRRR